MIQIDDENKKTKFENHAIKVHGKLQYTFTSSDNNNAESMLLERAAKEEKLVREQEDHIENHHHPLDENRVITVLVLITKN